MPVAPAALAADDERDSASEDELHMGLEPWREQSGRILLGSWNAGNGAHSQSELFGNSGYLNN